MSRVYSETDLVDDNLLMIPLLVSRSIIIPDAEEELLMH